jgi:hypothetical protein
LTATHPIAAKDLLHLRQVVAAHIVGFGVMQDLGIAVSRGQISRSTCVNRRSVIRLPIRVTSCLRSLMLAGRVDAARRPFPLRSTILRAARRQHARRAAACCA